MEIAFVYVMIALVLIITANLLIKISSLTQRSIEHDREIIKYEATRTIEAQKMSLQKERNEYESIRRSIQLQTLRLQAQKLGIDDLNASSESDLLLKDLQEKLKEFESFKDSVSQKTSDDSIIDFGDEDTHQDPSDLVQQNRALPKRSPKANQSSVDSIIDFGDEDSQVLPGLSNPKRVLPKGKAQKSI